MTFFPTYFTNEVTDIKLEILKKLNINGVLLDIDDTLVKTKSELPEKKILDWINLLKKNDIKIILVSNNTKSRVEKFAKNLDIPWVAMSYKPLTFKLKKAIKKISCNLNNVVMIGDQIFTDIFAANLINIKSILVNPMSISKGIIITIKRKLEEPIRCKIKSNNKFKLC